MTKSAYPMFNIHFVRAIERRSCIWNCSLPEYSKRNVTETAWKDVADEMKDSVPNCRERWRNIRGAFLRSLKKPPIGSSITEKKKYYLNEYLQFLVPYTKSRPSCGNLDMLAEINENFEESTDALKIEFEDQYTKSEDLDEDLSEDLNEVLNTGPQNPKAYQDIPGSSSQLEEGNTDRLDIDKPILSNNACGAKRRMFAQEHATYSNTTDDAFLDWLESKKDRSSIGENANMSFLRSILPDMMKMSEKQNRRFRQKVIGLMDDILEDADIAPRTWHSSDTNSALQPA